MVNGVIDRIRGWGGANAGGLLRPPVIPQVAELPPWRENPLELYALLKLYYHSVGVYDSAAIVARTVGVSYPAMKGLRNPAHRTVEFYSTHLWPDEYEFEDGAAVEEPVRQIWKWSNWPAKQRLAARRFAMLGDLFIKVASRGTGDDPDGRVWLQTLDPEFVTDVSADERGFVSYIRTDIPFVHREGDEARNMVRTEVWDSSTRIFRRWDRDRYDPELLAPDQTRPFSDFGIDFIPIVWAMFQDVGNPRGSGSFTHALEKIDEANLQATRLHAMLYRHNDVTWALAANALDATGRPVPAPRLPGDAQGGTGGDASIVTVGSETFYRLPGTASLQSLVPNLQYGEALAIMNAQLMEIENDLPEMAFHRLREQGQVSGRALRMMMTDAIDKVVEARSNGLQALIRADQMALTMASALGLPGFAFGDGAFAAGALDHSFKKRDVIAVDEQERWEAEKAKADAAKSMLESGLPLAETLKIRGYDDTEIALLVAANEAEKSAAAERTAMAFGATDPALLDPNADPLAA